MPSSIVKLTWGPNRDTMEASWHRTISKVCPFTLPKDMLTMSTAEQPEFVTVEDFLAAEESATTKSEFIDGWVRAISGGSARHSSVKMNCGTLLGLQLRGKQCRPYDSDMRLRIRHHEQTRFYYPDFQVVCEAHAPTAVYQNQPILIIEVLSPSTRAYDLDEKLNAYLSIPSLEGYVILEQHQPFAIVLRRTSHGFLRETYEGIETTIDLSFVACKLPLCEIYEGVEFTPTCVQEPEPAYEVGYQA